MAPSPALPGEAEIAARLSRPEGDAPLLYERLPHLQIVVRIVSTVHKDVELPEYVDEVFSLQLKERRKFSTLLSNRRSSDSYKQARQRLWTKLAWTRKNNAAAGGSVPATLPLLPPTAAPV
eukprot:6211827-Pleurochrysis_carterae.AAC.3